MQVTETAPIFRIFDEAVARRFYVEWLGFTVHFVRANERNSEHNLRGNREASWHAGSSTASSRACRCTWP